MKDRWSQLSMSEKSDLMSLYIRNGISSLEEIKKHYNSFATGGSMSPDEPPESEDNKIYQSIWNISKEENPNGQKERLEIMAANNYVKPYTAVLRTYPYFHKNYVISHSALRAYRDGFDHQMNPVSVSKYFDDSNYNLFNNNCSDATGEALNLDTKGLTTPKYIREQVLKKHPDAKEHTRKDNVIFTKFPISKAEYDRIKAEQIKQTRINNGEVSENYSIEDALHDNTFATGGALPDWDPEHKHIHTQDGKKVVIDDSVLNIKANQDDNSSVYKETVNNARLLELANLHYEDMNSDEFKYEKNPEYDKAYQALISRRFGQNGNLATNYWDGEKYTVTPLPKGYYRNEDGVIMDIMGNYYTPYREVVNNKPNQVKRGDLANGFYNTERDPYGYNTEVFYEKVVLPSKYLYDKPIKPQNADYRLSYSDNPIMYYHTYPLVLRHGNFSKDTPLDRVKEAYDYFDPKTNNLVLHKPNTPAPHIPDRVVSKQPYNTALPEYKYYKQMEDAGYGNLMHTYSYIQPAGFTLLDVKNPQNSMYGLEAASKFYWLTHDKPSRRNKLLDNGVLVPEFNLLDRLHYNSYKDGGPIPSKTPNFVQRFNEGNKRDIPFQGGHATHLLSYAERDGKYYVYPEVQPTDYNNSNSPLQYYGRDWRVAFDRAYDNNDCLEFDTEEAARNYSENYKKVPSTGAVLNGRNRGNYNILDYMRGYATGGSIEDSHKFGDGSPLNTQNQAVDNWMRYWYNNRIPVATNNIMQYEGAEQSFENLFDSLNVTKNKLNYALDEVSKIPIAYKPLAQDYNGFYRDDIKDISLKYGAADDVLVHEKAHALHDFLGNRWEENNKVMQDSPLWEAIGDVTTGDLYEDKNGKYIYDSYLDDVNEIYSRLMQIRYNNNLNPRKKWNLQEIKKLREEGKLNLPESDGLERYTDEFILHLFNDVAQNDSSQDTSYYAALGGLLPLLQTNS